MNNTRINIMDIHSQILSSFDECKSRVEALERIQQDIIKCQQLDTKKETSNYLDSCYQQNANKIKHLETKCDISFYLVNVIPIINKYKELLKKPIVMFFFNPTKKKEKTAVEKKRLEKQFIEFVTENNYFVMTDTSSQQPVAKTTCLCSECHSTSLVEEDDYLTCSTCGFQQVTDPIHSSYLDVDRTNLSTKYSYDRKFHFIDSMKQFQGKQNANIPNKIYDDVKQELKRHHLVDENAPNPYHRVTKKHIFMFLKETKHNRHYENTNLIYHKITGYPLDDISHLEDRLVEDFAKFAATHDKVAKPRKGQKRNFNYQYILYQLLRKHKYNCDPEDFNSLKTIDRQIYHDEVTKTVFDKLGWSHFPSF